MPGSEARIAQGALEGLAARAFSGLGVPDAEAGQAAAVLVLAEMMGISTHGIARVVTYGKRLASGGIDAGARIESTRIAPAFVQLDGGNGLGPAVGARALSTAMESAWESGVGVTLCRGSNHFGAVAPYCWQACEAGFAAIVMSNTTPLIAPTGGRTPAVGNNPIGFGFPGPEGRHVIVDMAISVAARSHIRRAAEAGEPIPDDWATDAEGRPTRDASAAMRGMLMGIGRHKGYGLALAVDMLAGVLSGAAFLTEVADLSREPGASQNLGHAFLLIDVSRLLNAAELAERMDRARDMLTSVMPVDPDSPVRLPGDRALARMRRARTEGIAVPDRVLDDLRALANGKEEVPKTLD
ncbi:Ldh family oxidoreductase [Chelativorans salis]|uniref:Ldh family oxidoreductase n=1 Tax=Chelativorans salis TaxID=2978478 RepID=A0ABT2LQ54_9HYPH|nr:Ldh family oxidoreductase [Chelativorans sp. EGI FJ00035]MCT7376691.1 Ldh family oxidoreductase [Chelativorans sp. EGI FJ00035]